MIKMKEFYYENLRGKTAESILVETRQTENIPVDIPKILRHYGLPFKLVDFSDAEQMAEGQVEKYGPILGATVSTKEDGTIICCTSAADILNGLPPRIILAHEFAHLCLSGQQNHVRFLGGSSSTAKLERKAIGFATELLLPISQIRCVSHELASPGIKTLAEIFQVPLAVMAFRLERCPRIHFI